MASEKSWDSIPIPPSADVSSARSAPHVASEEHPRRVVMIGTDEATQRMIAESLQREGYEVLLIPNDRAGLMAIRTLAPDLVVVDVQQPEAGGLTAVRYVRELTSVPILILSPHGHRVDRVIAGEEYLSKPFRGSELLRRIQTLLEADATAAEGAARDAQALPEEGDLRFDDLIIRPRLHAVERAGVPIDLSATEFDLLYFLAAHPRQVFTRQQLLDRVWHYSYFGDARTVTVHMSRLRKKVEPDPSNPRHLRTVWRVGYKFEP